MTEQECIERCEMLINGFSVNYAINRAFEDKEKGFCTFAKMKEFAETCKKVLQEIQQYRALVTVEELRVARDKQVEEICEWKAEKDMFIQNPHTKRKFSNEPSMKNTYCNTCGKKIKVGWIKCEDKLPNKSGAYLVTQKVYSVADRELKRVISIETDVVQFDARDKKWSRARFLQVTHWQPLPQPPKGE